MTWPIVREVLRVAVSAGLAVVATALGAPECRDALVAQLVARLSG